MYNVYGNMTSQIPLLLFNFHTYNCFLWSYKTEKTLASRNCFGHVFCFQEWCYYQKKLAYVVFMEKYGNDESSDKKSH